MFLSWCGKLCLRGVTGLVPLHVEQFDAEHIETD